MAADNRGGYRPTAPQNNPANINPLGGNGQSGKTQGMMRMPDMPWGQGQKSEDIGRAAPLAGGNTATMPAGGLAGLPMGAPIRGLTDPTDFPDRPVTYGNDKEVSLPAMSVPQVDSGIQFVQAMYAMDPTNQDLKYILETAANQGRI